MQVASLQILDHISLGFGKLGLGTRILDGLLDNPLNLIPVAGINALNLASEMLLDLAKHIPLFPVRDKGDSNTDAAESTRTTDTVKVGLVVGLAFAISTTGTGNLGDVVVDNEGYGGHVDSTSENVSRDEHLGLTTAEGINDGITLRALDTTGEGSNSVALGGHTLFNLHGRGTSLVGMMLANVQDQ